MMKALMKGCLLLGCFALLFGTQHVASAQSDVTDWRELMGQDYAIKYPQDWAVDTSGFMGMTFVIKEPLAHVQDSFQENVNLIIQDLSGMPMTLDAYMDLSRDGIKLMISEVEMVEDERRMSKETAYQSLRYHGRVGIYQLAFDQHISIVDDKAYVLTFTAERHHDEAYRDLIEEIFSRFTARNTDMDSRR